VKFLTLEDGRLGALLGTAVVDVPAAASELAEPLASQTLLQLVEAGDTAAHAAWQLAERAAAAGIACRDYADVRPLAPLPHPRRNIICLGKNYREHAKEMARKMGTSAEPPAHPIFFTKATTSIIGPDAPIPSHGGITTKVDYEAELAIIIGQGGKGISREQAMEHVFGYTIINDISARDLQKDHQQWFLGKSLDGFAPMGPLLAHRSIMPAPHDIAISCWVNGEPRQHATLAELIFDIPTIISTLSAGMTLLPGDIIATGTPAGVGMGFEPARYLQPGDEVVIDITGVGRLRNRIV
jgi:2-keto-4-pentenoate hydratase/2-oxohepta-3-ene-1,7-dioic acid hydratase in catechol pathway